MASLRSSLTGLDQPPELRRPPLVAPWPSDEGVGHVGVHLSAGIVAEVSPKDLDEGRPVRRLVDEGVLPIVPHMGQRIVIPRAAVARLVEGNPAHTSVDTETGWLRKVEAGH
jgi:hypothetical protein